MLSNIPPIDIYLLFLEESGSGVQCKEDVAVGKDTCPGLEGLDDLGQVISSRKVASVYISRK